MQFGIEIAIEIWKLKNANAISWLAELILIHFNLIDLENGLIIKWI